MFKSHNEPIGIGESVGPLRRRRATGVGRDSKDGDVHKPDSIMRKANLFTTGAWLLRAAIRFLP